MRSPMSSQWTAKLDLGHKRARARPRHENETHFSFPDQHWDDVGKKIIEHIAKIDVLEVGIATYETAVKALALKLDL